MQYFPTKQTSATGFSLVEVLVASGIFLTIALALNAGLVVGLRSRESAYQSRQALFYAEEALEATRNIRDASYTNLSNGTYGLVQSANVWNFSGSSDTQGDFTRATTITSPTTYAKKVSSTVSWTVRGSAKTVTAESYLTDLTRLLQQANYLTINTASVTSGGSGNRDVLGITLTNTGTTAIVLDKIRVTWTKPSRTITQVNISGTNRWASTGGVGTPSGAQNSGTLLDMTNVSIAPGATIPLTRLRFNASISSTDMTIEFTLGDGTTKITPTFFVE